MDTSLENLRMICRSTLRGIAIVATLLLGSWIGAHAQRVDFETVVGSDGSLRRGSGTYSAAGWRMFLDRDGAPRFIRPGDSARSGVAAAVAPEWQTDIGDPGITAAYVSALFVRGDSVYVGGRFERRGARDSNQIAVWDRRSGRWTVLPGGFDSDVTEIAEFEGDIIAGGWFRRVDDLYAPGAVRWDGTAWRQLGDQGFDGPVFDFLVVDGVLHARGQFGSADGQTARNVARLNGDRWEPLGDGLDGWVSALAVGNGRIFAAGSFRIPGSAFVNVAEWRDGAWHGLGNYGVSAPAFALEWHEGALYVGGDFYYADDITVFGIARWNGEIWEQVRSDQNTGAVHDLLSAPEGLYAVGSFAVLDAEERAGVARLTPDGWQSVGRVEGFVDEIARADNGDIYVGGRVSTADGETIDNIATHDGIRWRGLDGGLYGGEYAAVVNAVAVIGDDVFVGGTFNRAGGVSAHNVAAWNRRTRSWSSLGEGVNGTVFSLVAHEGTLVVGGELTRAGGTVANHVARWDPSTREWSSLSSGLRPVVYDMVAIDGELFVASDGVFRWDGTEWGWSSTGPYGWVYAVADHDRLVAAGEFERSGSVPTRNIARLGDGGWSGFGAGLDGVVFDMISTGDALIAGGELGIVDGGEPTNVARWRGEAWDTLGGPIEGTVTSLAAVGGSLFVGGDFFFAGTAFSPYLVQYRDEAWVEVNETPDFVVAALGVVDGDLVVGGRFMTVDDVEASSIAILANPASHVEVTHEPRRLDIAIAPNPAIDQLVATLPNVADADVAIEVVDALGRATRAAMRVDRRPDRVDVRVDCGDLAPGHFRLVVRAGEARASSPFVVVR